MQRYRDWYARLLRLYPESHYRRFGEGMSQTFNDLLRERAACGKGCWGPALAMFAETFVWILKTNLTTAMQNKHIVRPAIVTATVLLLPLVMTILDRRKPPGDGWHWGPGDFLIMGALLFGAGVAYELLARRVTRKAHRIAVGGSIAAVVFFVWFELAVDGVSQVVRLVFG